MVSVLDTLLPPGSAQLRGLPIINFKHIFKVDFIASINKRADFFPPITFHSHVVPPFRPCVSMQLSWRQAPQEDQDESRHSCGHGMEQGCTAEGSSPAHRCPFTGLDTTEV